MSLYCGGEDYLGSLRTVWLRLQRLATAFTVILYAQAKCKDPFDNVLMTRVAFA